MVEGMPTFTKASPLLKVLASSGIDGLDKLQIRLNKLYKDEQADQRQDASLHLRLSVRLGIMICLVRFFNKKS